MRRRLTVTGAGEGIDGISASGSTGNLEKIGQVRTGWDLDWIGFVCLL